MSEKSRAVATVTVTLEVEVGSKWGPDCTVGQVYKQAKDDAYTQIHNIIAKPGSGNIHISGDMEVKAIIIPENK